MKVILGVTESHSQNGHNMIQTLSNCQKKIEGVAKPPPVGAYG